MVMNTSSSIFHEGELEIQQRAGVEDLSRRVGASIHSVIPPVAQQFLLHQTMIILTGMNEVGEVWTTLVNGNPGFIFSPDEKTIRIKSLPIIMDPLYEILKPGLLKPVGCIIVEFNARRRMRVNGLARRSGEHIEVTVEQVYSNCHKRIRPRPAMEDFSNFATRVLKSVRLNEQHKNWILGADTFFIGSAHPTLGADASHRGGEPGFIQVVNNHTLCFPDYKGNNLFNTLGNITVNPRVCLLFIDFQTGSTLQLAGASTIHWETEEIAIFPGAERVVEFNLDQLVEIKRMKQN
jgi:predicted pyridoxine 5'-phosphate oxidase superfamily flavin-nucleotide-binding protein